MSKDPKIMIFDIETSHNILAGFNLLERNMLSFDNILQERHLFSAAWKWAGQKRIHAVSLLNDMKRFNKDTADDFHVVKTLRDEMEKADAIVAHYGDKFDMPYLYTRMAYHDIDPLPKLKQIDTYKIAKRYFKFNSNRLDYLGEFLNVGRKRETPKGLWLRCLAGEKKAIREMVAYNKQDIQLLEDVYDVLKIYVPNTCSAVPRHDHADVACVKCGSYNVQKRGPDRSRVAEGWHRLFCNDCRSWSVVKLTAKKKVLVR